MVRCASLDAESDSLLSIPVIFYMGVWFRVYLKINVASHRSGTTSVADLMLLRLAHISDDMLSNFVYM